MLLEFKLYKASEESKLFKVIAQYNNANEFIIVGEEKIRNIEYFKVHQLTDEGLKLIGGLPLDEVAYRIEKSDLTPLNDGIGVDYTEMDIPKEYLTLDLIETIQRLNL